MIRIRTLEEKQRLQGQLDEAKSNLESSVFTAKEVLNTMSDYISATDRTEIVFLIQEAENLLDDQDADQQVI
jgi:signal transduction histidine kinase